MPVQQLSHPWSRTIGVVLAGTMVFFLDIENPNPWHQLWLPLGLACAAYLMTRALMAVAITSLALAVAHSDISATSWVVAVAYPAIAVLSLSTCGVIAIRRFRRHIAATHDARWEHRPKP